MHLIDTYDTHVMDPSLIAFKLSAYVYAGLIVSVVVFLLIKNLFPSCIGSLKSESLLENP